MSRGIGILVPHGVAKITSRPEGDYVEFMFEWGEDRDDFQTNARLAADWVRYDPSAWYSEQFAKDLPYRDEANKPVSWARPVGDDRD